VDRHRSGASSPPSSAPSEFELARQLHIHHPIVPYPRE
jgi:hypothetical protein